MPSTLHVHLRRLLLAAGAPLLPVGCSDVSTSRHITADGSTAPSCAGGWGESTREGGCQSGPFKGKLSKYLLLHPDNVREKALYEACSGSARCPNELCELVLQYKPTHSQMIDESFEAFVECAPACQAGQPGVHVVYTVAGDCTGRRPEGLAADCPQATNEVGAYYASMAHLEAASVFAFERLARELVAHSAPKALVLDALRALADEARHYRMVSALARHYGGQPTAPRIERAGVRSLEEVVRENAVEGCVGETFGTAVVAFQAKASGDSMVRRAMQTIAREEEEHADLAFRVDAWASPMLTRAARRRVREGLEERASTLDKSVGESRVSPALERMGVPSVDAQMDLVMGLDARLWQA